MSDPHAQTEEHHGEEEPKKEDNEGLKFISYLKWGILLFVIIGILYMIISNSKLFDSKTKKSNEKSNYAKSEEVKYLKKWTRFKVQVNDKEWVEIGPAAPGDTIITYDNPLEYFYSSNRDTTPVTLGKGRYLDAKPCKSIKVKALSGNMYVEYEVH